MQWIRTVLREIIGLFVEDGSFALALFVWISVAGLVLHRLNLGVPRGIVLLAGLCVILIESVTRFARRAVTPSHHSHREEQLPR